jgi:hypothetical protein
MGHQGSADKAGAAHHQDFHQPAPNHAGPFKRPAGPLLPATLAIRRANGHG